MSMLHDGAKVDPLCEANNSPAWTSPILAPTSIGASRTSISPLIRFRNTSSVEEEIGVEGREIGAEMSCVEIRGGIWRYVAETGPLDHFRGSRNLGGEGRIERDNRFFVRVGRPD